MAKSGLVDEAADELYGLPPGEFTRARDERAKELRGGGEREAANAVKALRRPTVAAWALNQLARRRRKDLDKLLSAGEGLRATQEELLAGGDRAAFQDAAALERDLVAKLAADATTLASEAGERGGGLQEKVAETLHAAALDEEIAEELRAGRLVKEREAIGGFGAMPDVSAASPRGAGRKPRAASAGGPRADSPARAGSSRPRSSTRAGSSRQRAEDAQRRQRLTAARTDERHARREVEAAERAVKHAEERAEAAEAHAREASERARTTAERLKEAKRAQTAARKAHARAERALAKAEDGAS